MLFREIKGPSSDRVENVDVRMNQNRSEVSRKIKGGMNSHTKLSEERKKKKKKRH